MSIVKSCPLSLPPVPLSPAGGTAFHLLTLQTGEGPKPKAQGDKVTVSGQTIRFDGRKIVLGRMGGS